MWRWRVSWFVAFALVSSCAQALHGQDSAEASRAADLERRVNAFDEDLTEVEAAAARLSTIWDDVATHYHEAVQSLRNAEQQLDQVSSTYGTVGSAYQQAAADYEVTAQRQRLYAALVMIAASMDAARLDAARVTGITESDCSPMSTATYRRRMMADARMTAGQDVDHIVPRALGGADHPLNYQLLPSSLNRSLGATWGLEKCLMVGQAACLQAIAISIQCGAFRGPWF